MKGWRKRQEDTYISAVSKGVKKRRHWCILGLLFHREKEISKFVSYHFTEELIINKNISTDIPLALKKTFLKIVPK